VYENDALAATCSDGDQIGVWVSDGVTVRLRDVVVTRDDADRGSESPAVRVAEVTRASIALRDAEKDPVSAAPPAETPAVIVTQPTAHDAVVQTRPPPRAPIRRAPLFIGSAGVSALMGVDAQVAALSAQVEVGVFRNVALAARLEYPSDSRTLTPGNSLIRVSPAFVGLGASVPLTTPSSFFVPRFGGGLGLAWLHAKELVLPSGGPATKIVGEDGASSLAAYANAGVSMRLIGLLRLTADGLFGATASRLVVRDQGTHAAYWGQPFGAVALRLEVMFQ
jgi:hypothetical protein